MQIIVIGTTIEFNDNNIMHTEKHKLFHEFKYHSKNNKEIDSCDQLDLSNAKEDFNLISLGIHSSVFLFNLFPVFCGQIEMNTRKLELQIEKPFIVVMNKLKSFY